jgi:polyisoprenoid-binding protein YceI
MAQQHALGRIGQGGIQMKTTTQVSFAAILLICSGPAMAQSIWNIDSAHSAAQFQVKHLMISNVRGEFGKMTGTISFDGNNIASVKAEAAIEVASINTREKKRDDHLRSADFFDAATYPTITFKSKRVEGVRGNDFNMIGDLTMRGVTREIALAVEATPIAKGMRGESRIGAHATAKLNRQDYGIKWNRALDAGGVVVSDEVYITLDLELIQEAKSKS